MALVTAAEYDYRFNMNLDPNGQDDRLPNVERGLMEAESIVTKYIGAQFDEDWTDVTVPLGIKSAILIVANALLDGGENGNAILAGLSSSDLKNPVVGLLMRYRDPAIA